VRSTTLSTEHLVWVCIKAPGWGSVNQSQFTHHSSRFGYSYRGRGGGSLTTMGWFLTLSTGWDPHILLWWPQLALATWNEGPIPEKTPRRQWGSNTRSIDCEPRLFTNRAIRTSGSYPVATEQFNGDDVFRISLDVNPVSLGHLPRWEQINQDRPLTISQSHAQLQSR